MTSSPEKKYFSMALEVPKDVWGIIAEDISIKDLLSLRATCTRLNAIVISMQARWYRAHQWFLAKNDKRRVKSAVRIHTPRLDLRCFPHDYKYPGRLLTSTLTERYEHQRSMIIDGTFLESDCCQSNHFIYRVPKEECDIPLDQNFKPRRNNYIYFYLIERSRFLYPRYREEVNRLESSINSMKREILNMEKRTKRFRDDIVLNELKLKKLKEEHSSTNIFEGHAVNRYKTPAGNLKKKKTLAPKK
jgi:hypothetical protein